MPKGSFRTVRSAGVAAAIFIVASVAPTSVRGQDLIMRVAKPSRGEAEYIRAVRPYANCLVAHKAPELPKLLGRTLPSDSLGIERGFAKKYPDCPRPKSRDQYRIRQLQGAIFEAMLARDFGTMPTPSNFDNVPQLVYYKDSQSDLAKKLNAALMAPFDCIARRQPAKVRAFLQTQPLSAEEEQAFLALRGDFPSCFPKGEQWELRAERSRPSLAEALYTLMRMSHLRGAGF
jgi:hypothetical protein